LSTTSTTKTSTLIMSTFWKVYILSILGLLKLSRFSRHFEMSLSNCRDQDSQLRPRRDKSRPPRLVLR
jgi:hypothetical protein